LFRKILALIAALIRTADRYERDGVASLSQ